MTKSRSKTLKESWLEKGMFLWLIDSGFGTECTLHKYGRGAESWREFERKYGWKGVKEVMDELLKPKLRLDLVNKRWYYSNGV